MNRRGAASPFVAPELELKLAIDPRTAEATIATLKRHSSVHAVQRGRWRSAHLVSTYYDTPDTVLAEAGVALRMRSVGTRWVQTVKGPPLAEAGGGMHARAEYEWPCPGPELDAARLATTPWRKLFGVAIAEHRLQPAFVTDFTRQTLKLAFDDATTATLCIDRGEIRVARASRAGRPVPDRRSPICEIEIELAAGNAARLYELARALAADLPIAVATDDKAARGYALTQPGKSTLVVPRRARTIALAADVAAPDALARIVLACLEQVAANAPGLLRDSDVEWVHQMRIGTRRLRSSLALAAPFLDEAQLAPLLDELKALASALGEARDLDVFATQTLPPFATEFVAAEAMTEGVTRLRAATARQRRVARAAVRALVGSRRFPQLVLGIGALCHSVRHAVVPEGGAPPAVAPTIAAYASDVLEKRHRQLERRAEACHPGTPDERHQLRIAAKKQRYAAEFFAPLLAKKRGSAYLKSLAALQDVLGRGNDSATAARLIARLHPPSGDAAAAAMSGWVAAQGAATIPQLESAWSKFAKLRKFWSAD